MDTLLILKKRSGIKYVVMENKSACADKEDAKFRILLFKKSVNQKDIVHNKFLILMKLDSYESASRNVLTLERMIKIFWTQIHENSIGITYEYNASCKMKLKPPLYHYLNIENP